MNPGHGDGKCKDQKRMEEEDKEGWGGGEGGGGGESRSPYLGTEVWRKKNKQVSLLAINLEVMVATKVIVPPSLTAMSPLSPFSSRALYLPLLWHPSLDCSFHSFHSLATGTNSALSWGPAKELLDEATSGEGPLHCNRVPWALSFLPYSSPFCPLPLAQSCQSSTSGSKSSTQEAILIPYCWSCCI